MNSNLRRYAIALGLIARVALAAGQQPVETATETAPPARAAQNARSDADTSASESLLALYNGEVKVLDLRDVVRIAVGNGTVLQASVVAANQVVLIGQQPGTTSLRVWTRGGKQLEYRVNVRPFDMAQVLRDAQDMLAGEPGITVKQIDGHVLIEGESASAQTSSRIAALKEIYPQVITSTVPMLDKPETVKAVAPPRRERMVYMEVRVVEILKSSLRNLGVNWAGEAQGPEAALRVGGSHNLPKPPNSAFFGIATNLASRLEYLERTGESWTLAEPTVSCRSGGSAKFTVGGEIPVQVSAGLGTTSVVYKEYGIILEFKPLADDKGNVSSSIVADVSQPDTSFSTISNGLIAFLKTRTETDVALKDNQTLVISGLLKNAGNRSVNGVPGAKDIPILGNLFKSKQYQNDRTELVVMVTPRSIEAEQQISAATIRHADEMQASVDPIINRINAKLAE
jgi:pilus assembly protein CpaC